MSKMAVKHILERIKHATADSSIAVFTIKLNPSGLLDAVFAATVASQQRLRAGDPALLGVWWGKDHLAWAKGVLEAASLAVSADYAPAQTEAAEAA